VLLYIERWLKVPVQLEDGSLLHREKGTPQGGVVSPLLANLFLHYAFDRWMQRYFPQIPFERYADDGICHCQGKAQAESLWVAIERRFAGCGLELHRQKTRIIYCKAFSPRNIQKKVSTISPTKTQPYVHRNEEHIRDVALYIHEAIEKKLKKNYPHGSILIVSFESDTIMLECDGDYSCLEKEVISFEKGLFSRIYIMENLLNDDLQPRWQFML
jgi:hypothetical protein